jgi:hypothetical protein
MKFNSDFFDVRDFSMVHHSALNCVGADHSNLLTQATQLGAYLGGRNVVSVAEGDLTQTHDGELLLTHRNFTSLGRRKYTDLRDRGIATTLDEALDSLSSARFHLPEHNIRACIELKWCTSPDPLLKAVAAIDERDLSGAVYFDSFFGHLLDRVGNEFPTSLHLGGSVGNLPLYAGTPMSRSPEVHTIPYATSFGSFGRPVIYGAVGSSDILHKISGDSNVRGAHYRPKDGKGIKGNLRMLWTSVTNSERTRSFKNN